MFAQVFEGIHLEGGGLGSSGTDQGDGLRFRSEAADGSIDDSRMTARFRAGILEFYVEVRSGISRGSARVPSFFLWE